MNPLIDKASTANIMAAISIAAGIAAVFSGIPNSEILLLLTGAGIGYLFKNGNINVLKTNAKGDPNAS